MVDVVYLDFAKAFNKVDHGVLIKKLADMGIMGKLGHWMWNFLQERTQHIVANGSSSKTCPVISGVPQGTVLGPILFLVLLNSLGTKIKYSFISSFADDTKILHR